MAKKPTPKGRGKTELHYGVPQIKKAYPDYIYLGGSDRLWISPTGEEYSRRKMESKYIREHTQYESLHRLYKSAPQDVLVACYVHQGRSNVYYTPQAFEQFEHQLEYKKLKLDQLSLRVLQQAKDYESQSDTFSEADMVEPSASIPDYAFGKFTITNRRKIFFVMLLFLMSKGVIATNLQDTLTTIAEASRNESTYTYIHEVIELIGEAYL